jgi:hypothetical protein
VGVRTARLLGLLLTIVVAGCQTASATTQPVPQLHVQMTVDGSFTYHGSYVVNAGAGRTCVEAGLHGNSSAGFVVGPPGTRALPLYFSLRAPAYSGPGTFHGAELLMSDGLLLADHGKQEQFHPVTPEAVSLSVAADGSGTATLAGLVSDDGSRLGANLQWSCATDHMPR